MEALAVLFTTPPLDLQEEAVIEKIDEIRRDFSYATQSRRWTGTLARMSFARGIQGSNSIEGYNVTIDDALAAAENEEPLSAQGETWAALMGYRNALTYILQLSDDPHFSFSRGLLRSLHYMMVSYDFARSPGKWRQGPIFVRNDQTGERVYEGPDATQVNGLMRELVDWLNESKGPPLVDAAMAHLNLVMIHPFSDGNGRMGRALQTMVLARGGILARDFCSIEEYLGRNRFAYYDVLGLVGAGSWHPERDARAWVRFCLTAHFRQASTLMRRARVMQRIWESVEFDLKKRGLPDRLVFPLVEAALGLKIRNATYRKAVDISENLASRDLKVLVDAGLLLPEGEKRGRYYLASPVLVQIGHEATRGELKSIPDPFDLAGYLPGLVSRPRRL